MTTTATSKPAVPTRGSVSQVNAGWLAFGVALGTLWGTVLAVVFARR